ncbi:MAG: MFS transporter [Candidatus Weimeria sp.]
MNDKRENKLSSRVFYGLCDIYGGGAFVIIGTFFTVFLTKALGIPVALAGTIPLIGKVWDAITDPIMGNITDRTKSRFGAKRFYILIGSILSAITFIVMWIPFGSKNTVAMYIFYMLMYMTFSTGFTIVMVPYNALLPDMVSDYTVRAKFSGTRIMFSSIGSILASSIPSLIIKDNTNPWQYFTVALIFSVIFFVAVLLTFMGTWEKQKEPVKTSFSTSFIQSLTVYKSRSYRIFIMIFLCGQGATDFVTGLAVYYVDDVLNAYGGGRFTLMMALIMVAQLIGTIFLTPLMVKTSKKFPILLLFPIRIVATLTLLFVSYRGVPFAIICFLEFIIGLGMAASSTTIYAILSDMADVDELITSINRPATCSAMATFVRKICTGLSSTIIGLFLALAKYNEKIASAGGEQSLFTQRGIVYIYVFAPVVLMVLALIFTIIFPIKKKEFAIVRKEISRRKGEDNSVTTPEEKKVLEKVTGFKFERLWKRENALKLVNRE